MREASTWRRVLDKLSFFSATDPADDPTTHSTTTTPTTDPTSGSVATSESAVSAAYTPNIGDGAPDPGEIVWAWVAYEEDPEQGKDRPLLVLDPVGDGWVCLMLSSQNHDLDAADEARYGRFWMDIGSGAWDTEGRPSEVRLDRLILLEPGAFRREGAALDPVIFAAVVEAASKFHEFDTILDSDN